MLGESVHHIHKGASVLAARQVPSRAEVALLADSRGPQPAKSGPSSNCRHGMSTKPRGNPPAIVAALVTSRRISASRSALTTGVSFSSCRATVLRRVAPSLRQPPRRVALRGIPDNTKMSRPHRRASTETSTALAAPTVRVIYQVEVPEW